MARRIKFNQETLDAIKQFIETEGHSVDQAANKFGVSSDTIRRVVFENGIQIQHKRQQPNLRKLTAENVAEIVHMYKDTDAPMAAICRQVKLEDYMVQAALRANFTEEEIKARKSRIYRNSKLGEKNPYYGKRGPETNNWIGGIVPDGQGYLMCKKPEWYTGRSGSDYVFYHSVIMCEALGLTEIPKGFAVHHIDHNPLNNNLNNLALLEMGAHSRLHQIESHMCKVQRLSIPGVGESPNA